ncbi:unnamed protein product [Prorocentrum cordatum]|uniref:Uncharacterized protein n=1 Tax=Prorocentrum cordatum TaxID=2364126 RepID=A0ABN9UNA5_9DINO|nr:unnamed protein product [Polarella glacialis]
MDNPHGSVLQLWACPGRPDAAESMKFELHAAGSDATRGTIRPARDASLCVSVPADEPAARLEIRPCAEDSPSGIFMFVGAGAPALGARPAAPPAGPPAVGVAPLAARGDAEAAEPRPSAVTAQEAAKAAAADPAQEWLQEAAVARLRRQRAARAAPTALADEALPGAIGARAPAHETDAEKARREAHAEAELLALGDGAPADAAG